MSHKAKRKAKHYHTFAFKLSEKSYYFFLRYGVLALAVFVAYLVFRVTEHNWFFAAGMARGIELLGEAGADCFEEGVE